MKTLFAVPWIEVEFGWGSRDEGYKVYDNLIDCIQDTKRASDNGNYEGGYFGPLRPLCYFETSDEIQKPYPKFVKELHFKSKVFNMEKHLTF